MPAPGVIIGGILATIASFTLGALFGNEIGTQDSHHGNSSRNRRKSDTGTQNSGNSCQNQSDSGNRGTTSAPGGNGIRRRSPNTDKLAKNEAKSSKTGRKAATSALHLNGGSAFYSWHFQEEGHPGHLWNDFGPSDNVALEELYCDVENMEVDVHLKDTGTASRHKELFLEGVSVNFEQMIMIAHSSKQFSLHRLSEPSYVQVSNNSSSTRWVWYWEDNDGWKKYSETKESSATKQEEIEAAFLDGEEIHPFQIGSYEYMITFDDQPMCQRNMENGTMRRVRRRPLFTNRTSCRNSTSEREKDTTPSDSYIPSFWSSLPPCTQYICVSLAECSTEFQEVEHLFKKSMKDGMMIEKIDRVQHPFMYGNYYRSKEYMTKIANGDQLKVNEKRLFHGTSPDAVEGICKENFDWRLNGKNGNLYGKGSYFTEDASYSHRYAKEDANKSRIMFLAKVLVGSYVKGNASFQRPPLKQPSGNQASDRYDSCVDDVSNPKIFVLFDRNQFYPEYIIQYRTS